MDPAELLRLLAGLAEHAQELAVEGQLVDAPRLGIGTVEHLARPRRDANRPGRAGGKGAGGDRRLVRHGADRRPRVRRHRHVDGELALEIAVAVEHVNAPIAAIRDVDIVVGVDRDAVRRMELAGAGAALTPRLEANCRPCPAWRRAS